MIITIDGPAGVGKSTVAKRLASQLGWYHINSGLFYRKAGSLFTGNLENLVDLFRGFLEENKGVLPDILTQDQQLTSTEAGNRASIVSSYPPLRQLINQFLRAWAVGKSVVAEGRDMSSDAFPEAELKVYLDATPEERAARRWREEGGSLASILEQIKARDTRDMEKTVGALRKSSNSYIVDSTYLTIDEVCEKVLGKLRTMIGQGD